MPLGGKILVASSAAAERKLITEILRWAGHTLSAETADIAHTLRRTRALFPDLVIIDSALDGNRGFKAAEIIILPGTGVPPWAGQSSAILWGHGEYGPVS
jgi:CheY-like chemotaxis protein